MYCDRTRATCCHVGATKTAEFPPPPAALFEFHTRSPGASAAAEMSEVPPTPVTLGCPAGSSTAKPVNPVWLMQSVDPESPDAASTVCPWAAASANSVASACSSA